MPRDLSLADYWAVVAKNKRLIVSCVFGATLLTLIVSLFLPNQYKAKATLLPVLEETGTLGLQSRLMESGLGIALNRPSVDQILEVLKSRTMRLRVINQIQSTELKEKLLRGKKEISVEKIEGYLKKAVSIGLERKSLLISISVVAKNSELASGIANTYTEELGKYLNENSFNLNFRILDPAIPLKIRFKPSIRKNIFTAFFLSLLLSVFYSFFLEYLASLKKQRSE